jgi:hypothetical protein
MEPRKTLAEVKEMLERAPAPRVTEDSIKAKIQFVNYQIEEIGSATLTLCFICMRNGFIFIGRSTPASPKNFNAEIGQRYAYDDAFKQIWTHEGYLLREKLSQ